MLKTEPSVYSASWNSWTVPALLFFVHSQVTHLFGIILFYLHPLIITWPNVKTVLSQFTFIMQSNILLQWKTMSETEMFHPKVETTCLSQDLFELFCGKPKSSSLPPHEELNIWSCGKGFSQCVLFCTGVADGLSLREKPVHAVRSCWHTVRKKRIAQTCLRGALK